MGGLLGECLNAYECGINEGFPSGVCHQGLFGNSLPSTTKVYCTFPAHCGFETNRRVSYFKSPSYPQLVSKVSDCPYTIDLLPGVCRVRIDFLEFKMKPIYHGQCDDDNLMEIRAGTSKAFIPMSKLCGTISTGSDDPLRTDGPHLYVHFETDVSPENVPQIPNKQKLQDSLEIKFFELSLRTSVSLMLRQRVGLKTKKIASLCLTIIALVLSRPTSSASASM